MAKLYYISEEMRNELLETFEAALTMALDQKDETTADSYSILIKHLKRLKRAEHLQQISFITKEKSKKELDKPKLPLKIKRMSLKQLSTWLKSVTDLSDEEKFELYYEEHCRVKEEKGSVSYDKLLKDLKIDKPKN